MSPAYLEAYRNGKLQDTAEKAFSGLASCAICPRKCRINRLKNERGFCKTGSLTPVYSFMAHRGEEPPLSGTAGSGTIFFSNCNMSCVYCQNYEFSQAGQGREVDFEQLALFMLELQKMGCHNINLVSPTHIMPQILKSLVIAVKKGLNLPLVYNTGGFELPEIIRLLEGIIDIYLPDMRYANSETAIKYSCAPDYPKYNQQAVLEMHRQVGMPKFNEKGIIERGLIIRHLVLPNNISGTEEIMKFISQEISADTYISLMSQYLPYHKAGQFTDISRRLKEKEYLDALAAMEKYGLHNGWSQESLGLERFAGVNIKALLKKD